MALVPLVAAGAAAAVSFIKHIRFRAKREQQMREQIHALSERIEVLESRHASEAGVSAPTETQHVSSSAVFADPAAVLTDPAAVFEPVHEPVAQPVSELTPPLGNVPDPSTAPSANNALAAQERFHGLDTGMGKGTNTPYEDTTSRIESVEAHIAHIYDLTNRQLIYLKGRLDELEAQSSETSRIASLEYYVQNISAELATLTTSHNELWSRVDDGASILAQRFRSFEGRFNGLEQVQAVNEHTEEMDDKNEDTPKHP